MAASERFGTILFTVAFVVGLPAAIAFTNLIAG
jgi:hypothetical protein